MSAQSSVYENLSKLARAEISSQFMITRTVYKTSGFYTLSVFSIFVHFCFQSSFTFKFQHYILFFVKVQRSYLYFHHLTVFISFNIEKWPWLFYKFLWKIAIASYCARVRGSVYKMKFRVLSREFDSIETFPGFVQLLGEIWV